MGRLSRGCLRCRQRRVRCDEERPSCRRCLHRNEVCEGYRDESSLIFRYETDKVIEQSRATQAVVQPGSQDLSLLSARKRSKSVGSSSTSRAMPSADPSALAPEEARDIRLSNRHPWLRELPPQDRPPVEEQAVDQFMDKYVLYPCNWTSFPGFLEHLPCMFNEVNVEGRSALRLAVRAAAYADASRGQERDVLPRKALECYGMALGALGDSLATPGKSPDDYDLMTMVVLDIFEVGHRRS